MLTLCCNPNTARGEWNLVCGAQSDEKHFLAAMDNLDLAVWLTFVSILQRKWVISVTENWFWQDAQLIENFQCFEHHTLNSSNCHLYLGGGKYLKN